VSRESGGWPRHRCAAEWPRLENRSGAVSVGDVGTYAGTQGPVFPGPPTRGVGGYG
jgi:hypothetical protein